MVGLRGVAVGVLLVASIATGCKAEKPATQPETTIEFVEAPAFPVPSPPASSQAAPTQPVPSPVASSHPAPAPSAQAPAPPPRPVRAPAAGTTSTLVWSPGNPAAEDPSPTTYWIAAEPAGPRVVGTMRGVLVANGQDVWRWTTKEWHMKTKCDEATQGTFQDESIFVSAAVQRVGTDETVDIIAGSSEPLNCSATLSSESRVLGTVGPYVFLRHVDDDYGGGAHSIVIAEFIVFDLAARKQWNDWAKEITVPAAAQRPLALSLGADPTAKGDDGKPLYVDLQPSMVEPSYRDGRDLTLGLCFEVSTTNVAGLWPSMSHGGLLAQDCPAARIPKRLEPYRTSPPEVASFVRTRKVAVGGWSRLPVGAAMPSAVAALFVGGE